MGKKPPPFDDSTSLPRTPAWLVVVVVLGIAALIILGIFYYDSQRREYQQVLEERLTQIAESKARQLHKWRVDELGDVDTLARSPLFRTYVRRLLAGEPSEELTGYRDALVLFAESHDFAEMIIVDPESANGHLLFGVTHHHASDREMLEAAREAGRAMMTEVHLHEGFEDAHLSIVTPVFGIEERESEVIGFLVVILDASDFIFPVVESWPLQTRTGESGLIARLGEEAVVLSRPRVSPANGPFVRFPLNATEAPAVQAVLGRRGYYRGADYRGRSVESFIAPIPDSNWLVISKLDTDEAFEDWRTQSIMILLMLGTLGIVLATTAVLVRSMGRAARFRLVAESENRFRRLFQESPIALWEEDFSVIKEHLDDLSSTGVDDIRRHLESDPDFLRELIRAVRIISANGKARELIGHHGGTTMPQFLADAICPESLSVIADEMATLTSGESGFGNELTLRNAGGVVIHVLYKISIVPGHEHDWKHMIVSMIDITDRRRIEEDLRETTRRYEQLAEHARTFTWEVDMEGLYTHVGHLVQTVIGYSPEDLVGKLHFYDLHPDDGREAFAIRAFEVLQAGEFVEGLENPIVTKDGSIVWVSTDGFPIRDEAGTLIGYRGADTDISARKKLEEEKRALAEELLHARKLESIGRLAGGVAHDFNNMLGVIMGHCELAMELVGEEEDIHVDLTEIHKAAERSANLTRQLLAFARKQPIAPKLLEINSTVQGMVNMLERLMGGQIILKWEPSAKSLFVQMDPSQIDQVLANLCVNARDAIANNGTVVIRTEAVVLDKRDAAGDKDFVPGRYVMLSVSDDGCGMDEEVREKIFEPFYTTKKLGQGTGLGLATVYGIVKQNHGFIQLDSAPGRGSTFQIYLPRHHADPSSATEPSREVLMEPTEATILLVEDESAMLRTTQAMLHKLGYHVISTHRPSRALRLVGEHKGPIPVLLTDVVMPGMNGKDLSESIKALRPGIRTVFMSGYSTDIIASGNELDPSILFLQKPFTIEDLRRRIGQALQG